MWLLSTSRAELHEFPSPEAVPGGYAILSHVWDEKEQTFQVTQWLRQICDKTGANPRDSSHPKIRNACALAESHGYKWLWVDTSCIDKSSSADLSEAINSMYRYYSIASICYAYLHDVPPRDTHRISQPHCARETRATFMQSKWHTRGWTLQELIAPTFVLFLADNWTNLGTKAELADVLQTITYIPASLLRLDTRLADYSVAQRMSWAASRKTTRPEDRAYSLLGIFGINMSTLYGEGEQAFYRLQEEIMKRRADTTLFAWGSKYSPFESLLHPGLITEHKYLLASSPDYFRNCGNVLFTPPGITARNTLQSTKGLANNEHSGTITFSITPYGVLAHIPLIEHWYEDSAGDEVTAYLFWSDHLGNPIGLRLKPCPMSADPFRPHYDVVQERLAHGLSRDGQGRLLDSQRGSVPQPVRLTWQEVYITCRPPPESIVPEHAGKVFVPMNLGSFVPFRILDKDIDALPTSPVPIELTACGALELPWDGDPPVILQFQSRISFRFYAMLHLGQCHKSLPVRVVQTHWWPQDPNPDLGHWAFIQITTKRMEASVAVQRGGRELAHNCHLDHINRWPNKTKSFPIITGPEMDGATVDDAASIILQFDTCPLNPKTTLIMRITTR
ncbi:hypothetical protein GSI_01273 [Ganoderma sinense ZZ0214-1]|uniref:Uncharacterized protein n=1 Tax=Ganoderma sinense ZZ0214-1 TaxID=1077348 RepID=A0A2G8SUY0_9APHY|nr:hypothetical protein GSI_01273 [Ganoderma sinense ZZ0214-1]